MGPHPQCAWGDVAQTGEHLLCKQGVSGSIPLISTKGTVVGFTPDVGIKNIEI